MIYNDRRLIRTAVLKCSYPDLMNGEARPNRKCVWAWELQLVASRAGQAIRGWTVDGRMRKIQVLWRNAGGHAHAQWSPRLSSIDELEQSTRVRLSSCELRAFTRATTPRAGTGPHRPDDGRAKGTRRPKPIINDDRKETTRATASQQLYKFFFLQNLL